MASQLRQAARPTPAIHDRALQDLSFIRRTMEGASSFTDVPGWGLVVIGITALGASAIAAAQPSAARWLGVWMAEAFVGTLLGGAMMWRKMRRRVRIEGSPVFSVPARKFLLGFWPSIFAGAVLTFALIDMREMWTTGSAVPHALPGMWLLLYGVGVITAGAFSVRAVPLMGAVLIVFGTIALLVPGISGNVMLAIGFGLLQVAFGLWIARRHGG